MSLSARDGNHGGGGGGGWGCTLTPTLPVPDDVCASSPPFSSPPPVLEIRTDGPLWPESADDNDGGGDEGRGGEEGPEPAGLGGEGIGPRRRVLRYLEVWEGEGSLSGYAVRYREITAEMANEEVQRRRARTGAGFAQAVEAEKAGAAEVEVEAIGGDAATSTLSSAGVGKAGGTAPACKQILPVDPTEEDDSMGDDNEDRLQQQQQQQPPHLTNEEQKDLSKSIGLLSEDDLRVVMEIIQRARPSSVTSRDAAPPSDGQDGWEEGGGFDEVDVEIKDLDGGTQRELRKFVDRARGQEEGAEKEKKKRKGPSRAAKRVVKKKKEAAAAADKDKRSSSLPSPSMF